MKIYATVASERAKKGQGGNEYLKIIVRNEKQQCIAYLTFKPSGTCEISVIKDIKTIFERVEWIGTDDDTKGEKQKGEKQKDKFEVVDLHAPDCQVAF